MSTNEGAAVLKVCRGSLACRGILAALLFTAQQAPQSVQANQTQQAPQTPQGSQPRASPQNDLTQVSIENLMNVEVTSVSKKEQKLSQVAAAIFVITQEDIRSSGALNIPDLLRMVPGLEVAQINANTWAISSRGFNLQFANRLLVLIDGRAVYTPLFGGVNWDTQDVPLEDIERIEVICGPGGTVWGANAVDGVINIITKKTADTLGGLTSSEHARHGLAQFGLPDGLQKICGHPQFLATRCAAPVTGRSEHHDRGRGQFRSLPDLFNEREAVHIRHVHVRQNQVIRIACFAGREQLRQCRRASIY
jgi:outer membrane receptor for Fe3+-dicitrate